MAINLWDRKKILASTKVGSFFLAATFIFFIAIFSIKQVSVFKGKYTLVVTFDFVEGLRHSSPVRFCGVDVGEIDRLHIKSTGGKPLVYVYAKIQNGVNIPRGSHFFINSLSLFGEKYLEITPALLAKDYYRRNETVEGISPMPLFSVVANFNKTMEEVKAFVKEGKLKSSVENIVSNLEAASFDIKGLFSDLRSADGTVGRLLHDDSLYTTTEEFIKDLKAHPWKLLHKPKGK